MTTEGQGLNDWQLTAVARSAAAKVTRLVIEKDGIATEFWADRWDLSIQDDGRTVKMFAKGSGVQAATIAAQWLGDLQARPYPIVASSDAEINSILQQRFADSEAAAREATQERLRAEQENRDRRAAMEQTVAQARKLADEQQAHTQKVFDEQPGWPRNGN
ncbi:hypothetical protein [Mycobacteroides abscessus]|uniref:hypothetical protein n=1 Tax=Mycobacteroides abscessus TaxID=36809 RepID=UPI0009A6C9D0|nr:hypothetical protein [Mycobacteroides abscessus]SLH41544.1 Uncharacterised protein [Mycobacteroides abscessus subsp. massiliense]